MADVDIWVSFKRAFGFGWAWVGPFETEEQAYKFTTNFNGGKGMVTLIQKGIKPRRTVYDHYWTERDARAAWSIPP